MFVFVTILSQLALLTIAMNPNPQPCLICGGAVSRIWSMHSRVGDRYLRIDPTANFTNLTNVTSAMKVDFAGVIDYHFYTALVKFKDVSVGFPDFETRIQMTFYHNGTIYHLQAVGVDEELRAIPENEAANLTDNSDMFSPERLKYEHHLFYVFESVKFRKYYLGTKGDGESKLLNIHSEAYRDPETLFKMIDPGNEIASASFGSASNGKRRRRAVSTNMREIEEMFPGRLFERKTRSITLKQSIMSSIRAYVKIPVLEAFTLCFWVKTKDDYAQIFSIVYDKDRKPKINVSIFKGRIRLELNRERPRTIKKCQISDGKWHHVCVSIQKTSRMFVHKDGASVYQGRVKYYTNKNNSLRNSATVYLGRRNGFKKKFSLNGDLTQVNIWDEYPLFRIRRIATNSACGGGNIVQWKDFLKTSYSRDVSLYSCEDCPKRVGYNFDKKTQNNLV